MAICIPNLISTAAMRESFGARVRQHRERHGLSLEEIAGQTKIKLSLLEGLERDDVSHWPPGIFRRAYVRAYAQAIQLDPDVIVREFFEVYPPPAAVEPPPTPPTGLRALVGSALGPFARRRRTVDLAADAPSEGFAVNIPPAPIPVAADPPPVPRRLESDLDLLAAAHLCTELGRVEKSSQLPPLLREAARILDARGLIVWVWDALAAELKPALVHGYSDQVIAHLAGVRRDADNVTAAAFRSAQTCIVNASAPTNGALVVPILTSAACAGVLAIELRSGGVHAPTAQAIATVLAAMLAQLIGGAADGQTPTPAV
jgi:transcriptional regulator with XRE-family HTH domain